MIIAWYDTPFIGGGGWKDDGFSMWDLEGVSGTWNCDKMWDLEGVNHAN